MPLLACSSAICESVRLLVPWYPGRENAEFDCPGDARPPPPVRPRPRPCARRCMLRDSGMDATDENWSALCRGDAESRCVTADPCKHGRTA